MVRGRTPGRGRGRGAASTRGRGQTENTEAGPAPTQVPEATEAGTTATDNGTPAPARRGASARATRAPTSTARFRPKNVRRDEAERDSLARQEELKANERAAEERRTRGRSRFRSKRSRGDTMGTRGNFGHVITGASGPFSSGMSSSGGLSRPGGGGGGGFGGSGPASTPRSKGPVSFAQTGKSIKGGPDFDTADSGYTREARINADKLNVMTPEDELDSGDERMMAALSSRGSNVFPMGIYRREHKDTGVVVATTAELEAAENAEEEESLWVDGQDPNAIRADMQAEEQGTWDTDSKRPVKVQVKQEPGTEDMDLDSLTEREETEGPAVKAKVKKALAQDPEEKMIQSDLNVLANELGAVTITEDGEIKTQEPANKDGRMYLFQFPPLLPPLNPSSIPSSSGKVKAEPPDVDMLDASAASDPTPVDLTGAETNNEAEAGDEDDPQNKHGFMSSLLSQGGMIGKLNVRKSGKVELDWGGRILEMSPATGMNFQTTAVIVEESDEKPQHGVIGGESIGMGKIMGRFVLAPTWSEEEEWIVDPDELTAG